MGIFSGLRRRRLLRNGLIDEAGWKEILQRHPLLDRLDPDGQARLREMASLFAAEKTFEGARGLLLSPMMRQAISALACLPVLNLGLDCYRDWRTVVVVPAEFTGQMRDEDQSGLVHEWEEEMSGEVYEGGPVVLSWADVEASGQGDGYNVVIHEAAHKLDLLDGEMNGRPALERGISVGEWSEVFAAAFADFRLSLRKRRKTQIDSYAAESDAEFFAVASEHFFERPLSLRRLYPAVYRLLAAFYRIEPQA
jgi:MtfA peptidase